MKYVSKNIGEVLGLDFLVENSYVVSVGYVNIGSIIAPLIKIMAPSKRDYNLWFDPVINYWW